MLKNAECRDHLELDDLSVLQDLFSAKLILVDPDDDGAEFKDAGGAGRISCSPGIIQSHFVDDGSVQIKRAWYVNTDDQKKWGAINVELWGQLQGKAVNESNEPMKAKLQIRVKAGAGGTFLGGAIEWRACTGPPKHIDFKLTADLVQGQTDIVRDFEGGEGSGGSGGSSSSSSSSANAAAVAVGVTLSQTLKLYVKATDANGEPATCENLTVTLGGDAFGDLQLPSITAGTSSRAYVELKAVRSGSLTLRAEGCDERVVDIHIPMPAFQMYNGTNPSNCDECQKSTGNNGYEVRLVAGGRQRKCAVRFFTTKSCGESYPAAHRFQLELVESAGASGGSGGNGGGGGGGGGGGSSDQLSCLVAWDARENVSYACITCCVAQCDVLCC